jgi:hypothetical protein
MNESRISKTTISNKNAEIYIAEMNSNFIKPLLLLLFKVKLIRCPTDQLMQYFN